MQRMTGIDPMFVYSDTPETPMEIAYACVLDPASVDGGYSFDRVVRLLEERIPTLPFFRRRVLTVPLGLDHPRWVDDPDYDLGNHLHRAALPDPGGEREFAARGAQDGAPARVRAAAVGDAPGRGARGRDGGPHRQGPSRHGPAPDGVAGRRSWRGPLDLTQEGSAVTEPCPPGPSRPSALADPPGHRRAPERAADPDADAAGCGRGRRDDERGWPGAGRRRRAPAGDDPARRARHLRVAGPRPAVRRVRRARYGHGANAEETRFSSTINEVVLAVCSGALRTHLSAQGEEADEPLVAVVPVSVRPAADNEGDEDVLGNQLSAMFVPLANDRQTPLERLRAVSVASAECKGQEACGRVRTDGEPDGRGHPAGAGTAGDPARHALGRAAQGAGGQPRRSPTSPVRDFSLYFAGMELRAAYPLGPVVDGIVLNVTVQSYRETLFVGLNACPAAVRDLKGLAVAMADELALLGKMAAAAGSPRPVTSSRRLSRSSSAVAGAGAARALASLGRVGPGWTNAAPVSTDSARAWAAHRGALPAQQGARPR